MTAKPHDEIPLVMQVSAWSRSDVTRTQLFSRNKDGVAQPSRRRVAAFGIAGAVCAVGLFVALGTPTSPPSTPLPDVGPTASLASGETTQISESGDQSDPTEPPDVAVKAAPDDPRAFVLSEARAGRLGAHMVGLTDLSATVGSRNGDVVLVEVSGRSDADIHSVSALVVRTADGWIVRETYTSGA